MRKKPKSGGSESASREHDLRLTPQEVVEAEVDLNKIDARIQKCVQDMGVSTEEFFEIARAFAGWNEHKIPEWAEKYWRKKGRGRPSEDLKRLRVLQLRAAHKSWGKIQQIMNRETGENLTSGAYRNLVKRKP
jgi:hypothetical protein